MIKNEQSRDTHNMGNKTQTEENCNIDNLKGEEHRPYQNY